MNTERWAKFCAAEGLPVEADEGEAEHWNRVNVLWQCLEDAVDKYIDHMIASVVHVELPAGITGTAFGAKTHWVPAVSRYPAHGTHRHTACGRMVHRSYVIDGGVAAVDCLRCERSYA